MNHIMNIPIRLSDDDHLPLHRTWRGETADAFLAIHCARGAAEWGTEHVANGQPVEVSTGQVYRIPCSPSLSRTQLVELTAAVQPLVNRIVAGCSEEWDRQWNRVGALDDDASDALDELTERLAPDEEGRDHIAVVRLHEWGWNADFDELVRPGQSLEEAAEAMIEQLRSNDMVFDTDFDGIVNFLEELRAREQDAAEEGGEEDDEDDGDDNAAEGSDRS
jgi:hypothetical protein